uniref:Uncharacterized protein n=2 Tax=Picea TaxID=3328 RepID=A0A124GMX7_PICGL|nr:hypothetical protein ABT39_MTgene6082 [Picea glauca]QHR89960.1 hypothetical protein Q903MT_gene3982 [Picea sitchensis]
MQKVRAAFTLNLKAKEKRSSRVEFLNNNLHFISPMIRFHISLSNLTRTQWRPPCPYSLVYGCNIAPM